MAGRMAAAYAAHHMTWDAGAYLRFGDERTRPAADLAARVQVEAPATVVDLGCGPGNSTRIVCQRWPHARVSGVDSSPEMIAAARRDRPDLEWHEDDIATWTPAAPVDVVFSNAALQWLSGHVPLVQRLFGFVAAGGALALQMPCDAYSSVRQVLREVADDPAWHGRMADARTALTMEQPTVYYDALARRSARIDLWETEYAHVLAGPEAVVEWMSSTGMRPYLAPLTDAERERFRERVVARVVDEYPVRADGRILFPFRRLFLIAYA